MLGRPQLGAILVSSGLISAEQLNAALVHHATNGCRVGEALVTLGFCTEKQIAQSLAEQLEIAFVDLETTPPLPGCASLLPREVALEYEVVPVCMEGSRLLVAVRDPFDIRIDEALRRVIDTPLVLGVAPESQLQHCLQRSYVEGGRAARLEVQPREEGGAGCRVLGAGKAGGSSDAWRLAPAFTQHPAPSTQHASEASLRVIEALLADAVREAVSEVHFEPGPEQIRVRCRADGRLRVTAALPRVLWPGMLAILKRMCGLSPMEGHGSQEGGCRLRAEGREVEAVASTLRGVYGEKVVLGLRSRERELFSLAALGLQPELLAELHRRLIARQGLLLASGPGGSGKSTTLYALLASLNSAELNLMTVEETLELPVEGVHQVPVHAGKGSGTAATLKAVLRQAPDVLMVEELRDPEAVALAARAALAGCLILGGLPAQDAPEALARLLDLGADPWLIATATCGVLAQQLIPRVCEVCAEAYAPEPRLLQALEARFGPLRDAAFRRGKGCAQCHGSGTRGRVAVFELLLLDEELRSVIAAGEHCPKALLRSHRRRCGLPTLEEDAYRKACLGVVAPEEVMSLGLLLASEELEGPLAARRSRLAAEAGGSYHVTGDFVRQRAASSEQRAGA
jgi:type II secretory ATPase GspE/PulE/Tfp pilus assembly ATPase PilB-like protein